VDALAGELTIASEPGEGTRVEVCLPLPSDYEA
jgi:signal transduction histidine kinase